MGLHAIVRVDSVNFWFVRLKKEEKSRVRTKKMIRSCVCVPYLQVGGDGVASWDAGEVGQAVGVAVVGEG